MYVEIGPHRYEVFFDQSRLDRASIEHQLELNGCVDHSKLEIIVSPSIHVSKQREVLWHEVKHAVWHLSGADNVESLTEEQVIVHQTAFELDILRRNKWLADFLLL